MPLYLTDEQQMLRDTAKDFVAEHAPVSHMRRLRDADDATGFSRDLWKQFAELGLTGILIPESDNGLGLGHVEAGVVLEEIGRNLSPSPFLTTAVAAVEALEGTPHAARWFPGILAGETVAALAIDEHTKHDGRVAMQAERPATASASPAPSSSSRTVMSPTCSSFAAATDHGTTLFAVPADAKGLTADPQRLADASLAARLSSTASKSMPTRWSAKSTRRPSPACSPRGAPVPRPNCSASAAVRWT